MAGTLRPGTYTLFEIVGRLNLNDYPELRQSPGKEGGLL